MHDMVEPSGSPRPWRQYICVEPLVENTTPAENGTAAETPGAKHETNPTSCNRQIRKMPRVSTVDSAGYCSARWTLARRVRRTHGDERAINVVDRIIRDKASRISVEARTDCMALIPFETKASGRRNFIKSKSEPKSDP